MRNRNVFTLQLVPSMMVLLSILSCLACQQTPTKTAANTEIETATNTHTSSENAQAATRTSISDTLVPKMGCYYALDDKYAEAVEAQVIAQWWKQRLSELQTSGITENLFSYHEGGPSGAAWNPYTDLYLAALIPYSSLPHAVRKKEQKPIVTVYLNDQPIKNTVTMQHGDSGIVLDFVLKRAVWYGALQPMTPVYSKHLEDLVQQQNTNIEELDLTAFKAMDGKCVKIEIKIQPEQEDTISIVNYFLAAYGE